TATVTTMGLPAAPSNLTAMARSSAEVDLAWKDNSGTSSTNPAATSFKLYRSTDNVSWSWFATPGQGTTSYTGMGRSASTTYYYKVNAYDSVGASAYSNTANATTNAPGHLSRQLPSASTLPEVTYHGGPLLQHVQVESVYAGPAWTTDAGLQQQMQQLDAFLNYFVDSTYALALKQYGVSSVT